MSLAPYHRRPRASMPGLVPTQLLHARGWDGKPVAVAPVQLGFVSLGGSLASADRSAAATGFALPSPKLTFLGTPGPADPNGADVENALDLWSAWLWSAATGLPADLTIAWQPNTGTGLANGIRALADAGVQCASISWGAPETQWAPDDRAATESALAYASAKGCWVCVASGDNSADDGTNAPTCDYPCGSAYALAVGGTKLLLRGDGAVASESAWGDGRPGDAGGGGGLDTLTPLPAYQALVLAGRWRGVPDLAEVADPATGYAVYCGGRWLVVGGTSGAAPSVAGLLAIARGAALAQGTAVPNDPHALLYQHPECFVDIATGSDGNPAKPGYDLVTGLGTLRLPELITLFRGGVVPPPTPVPIPLPPPVPVPPPSNGVPLNAVLGVVNGRFQSVERRGGLVSLPWLNAVLDQDLAGLYVGHHEALGR